jgi:hypothetical protein
MSAEDRLREILRSEASGVVPAGDGLARIQERVGRRRRRRAFLLPGAALATAGAAAAFFLLGGTGGTQQLVQDPTTQVPRPTSRPTDGPPPSPSAPPVRTTYTGPALWPFTSASQAAAWGRDHADRTWAGDAGAVASRFGQQFLGLSGVDAVAAAAADRVTLRVGGQPVGEVRLARYDVAGGPAWTVVSVSGGDLRVTSPRAGEAISSPTTVTGRITGVDENVRLRLVTAAGKEIATAGAPAGSAVPWQGPLSWSDTGWTTAAVVGTTYSPKDGALTRLVVVPVTRATGSSAAASSFVALVDGHVSLFDGVRGTLLRQLTYPSGGTVDTGAAWSSGTLLWVRGRQPGCADELDLLAGGKASTLVRAGTARLGTPQLSPAAGTLAWLETPCGGGAARIVVSAGGAPRRSLAVPAGTLAQVLDVRDDGTLLVHLNDRAATDAGTVGVVPAGAQDLGGIRALAPTGSCYLAGGAAFLDLQPVAFETCGSDSRLVTFTARGARVSTGPAVPGMAAPRGTSGRSGQVLVWLTDGTVARYASGALTTLVRGAASPDW